MKRETGGPAFPFVEPSNECNVATGMTLRDYFAAKVLEGRMSIPGRFDNEYEAALCYNLADAMLEARKK